MPTKSPYVSFDYDAPLRDSARLCIFTEGSGGLAPLSFNLRVLGGEIKPVKAVSGLPGQDRRPPPELGCWSMASLSRQARYTPACKMFADGTKIAADLNNL